MEFHSKIWLVYKLISQNEFVKRFAWVKVTPIINDVIS